MTGPEHYREAERLIRSLKTDSGAVYIEPGNEQVSAIAQVHATLALAAATAMSGTKNGMAPVDFKAWDAVAGVPMDGDA
ncbi:hypothetical protein ABTZ58_03880 [Streptomyces sp. NPDC094143]|jgi:hypothetical protein|uniref:hypothetical protein n=1 Tax=unclassified Streptomyces TaxID=2593676 RepID=UPI003319D5DD